MTKLQWKQNEVTNLPEAYVAMKLLSISPEVLEFNNEKKTKYRLTTVEFDVGEGKESTTAIMYESNFKYGVEIGSTYAGRVSYNKEAPIDIQLYFTVSHLPAAKRLTLSDLGLSVEDIVIETEAEFKEIAKEANAVQ
ncbi:MAG: hypothetical protein GY775_16900 [Candidatus Scalindua sp.]|nr:hypothetical protein [Candidatus Scalindua sp.]